MNPWLQCLQFHFAQINLSVIFRWELDALLQFGVLISEACILIDRGALEKTTTHDGWEDGLRVRFNVRLGSGNKMCAMSAAMTVPSENVRVDDSKSWIVRSPVCPQRVACSEKDASVRHASVHQRIASHVSAGQS